MTAPVTEPVAGRRRDLAPGWYVLDALVAVGRRVRLGRAKPVLPYGLLLPAVLLIGMLAGGLGYMLWLSFHALDTATNTRGDLSLEQYDRLVNGVAAATYQRVLIRTVVTSLIVMVSAVALAVPTAFTLVRLQRRVLRRVALILLLVPFLMGETVRTTGWVLLIGREGFITWLSDKLGYQLELLGSSFAVWIGMLQVMFPIATLVMMPAVRRINPDLERAAQTMGARPWRVWVRIVLPLARSGIVASALVVLTLSMTEFSMPRILGLGKRPFVANTVQQIYLERGNLHLGSAFSAVLLLTTMALVGLVSLLGRARRPR